MKKCVYLWQGTYPREIRVDKLNLTLKRNGYETFIVAKNKGHELETEVTEFGTILRTPKGLSAKLASPFPYNPVWIKSILSALKLVQPEVIIIRDIVIAPTALAAIKKSKAKIVLDMAEHYPEAMRTWDKYKKNPLLKLLVHDIRLPDRIEKSVMKKIDNVLVVCEEQKERLMREYGTPADCICVTLNTPDLTNWKNFPKGTKNSKPSCFGYHGILCEDRALETVLEGFDLAADKEPDITLLIAGGGESEKKLRKIREGLKHKDRITFTGRYGVEDLPALYERADFGIVSLRVNEFTKNTLANKFFDYPALGKPFIHTDLAPLNRISSELRCSVKFEGGNPLSVAQSMIEIRKRDYNQMSRSGIAAVEKKYNWSNDEMRLFEFLNKLG
jgi:glycosyltransferase involved in cell wall biosynthesis